jgi:hypothetical protein
MHSCVCLVCEQLALTDAADAVYASQSEQLASLLT